MKSHFDANLSLSNLPIRIAHATQIATFEVDVIYESFKKKYSVDLIIGEGKIKTEHFRNGNIKSKTFRDVLVSLVRDWGMGLEMKLYKKALIHFLGSEDKV